MKNSKESKLYSEGFQASEGMEYGRKTLIQNVVIEVLKRKGVFNDDNDKFDLEKYVAWGQVQGNLEKIDKFLGTMTSIDNDALLVDYTLAELGYGSEEFLGHFETISEALKDNYS